MMRFQFRMALQMLTMAAEVGDSRTVTELSDRLEKALIESGGLVGDPEPREITRLENANATGAV